MRGSFLFSHPNIMLIKPETYCKWACAPDTKLQISSDFDAVSKPSARNEVISSLYGEASLICCQP
jgi:hypothetical protein